MRFPPSGLGVLLATVLVPTARAQTAPPPAPSVIVTSGHAESTVAPDRATIFIAIQTTGATAAAAGADNAHRTRATLDTLRALGLSKDQSSTSGYSLQPQYSYDKGTQKVIGYESRNTIKVETRKLDEVGRLIDAALAAGANSIANLEFSASSVDDARRDAIARATAQAKGDAEAIARAAGVSVGLPLELTIENNDGQLRPVVYFSRKSVSAADAAPTPVDAGPLTISVTVQTRWQIFPGTPR